MLSRRDFLHHGTLIAGAGVTGLSPFVRGNPVGANDRIRVGLIGLGLKGAQLANIIARSKGVEITALCDVDPRQMGAVVEELDPVIGSVFTTTDLRRVLERVDVDAVVIATGTHWHALATVWACEAGKDVYVEKPVGRTVWEGRQVIEAADRYDRVVQTGTQLRADRNLDEITAHIRSGELGRIQWMHGISYTRRDPMKRRLPWYPDWMDYDMFCGSSPMVPLARTNLHYDWHWNWNTGNGDLVNMGVHMVDVARRFIGDDASPRRVMSTGGRFVFDDCGEVPNTQFSVIDFGQVPLFFENRALPAQPGSTASDVLRRLRKGIIVQCEHGYYAGYYGGDIFDNAGNRLLRKAVDIDTVTAHLENFFGAVRSRRTEDLNAPPQVGHDSARFCHYGNLSYRVGRAADVSDIQATLVSVPGATEALERMTSHLARHDVDISKERLRLGPWLNLRQSDDGIESVEGEAPEALAESRYLLHETQRNPYIIS